MKKIFITLALILAVNFVFAETKFMGIPMGISKEEAEQNTKNYEEKIGNAFLPFFTKLLLGNPSLTFYYIENEPQQVCGFEIEFYTNNLYNMVSLNIGSYLLDNHYKKISDSIFYNDDFIVVPSSGHIIVYERSNFKRAMDSLMK